MPTEGADAKCDRELIESWNRVLPRAQAVCKKFNEASGEMLKKMEERWHSTPASWRWILQPLYMWPADYVDIVGPDALLHPQIADGVVRLSSMTGHADLKVRQAAVREVRRLADVLIRKADGKSLDRDERAADAFCIEGLPYAVIARRMGFDDDARGRAALRAAVKRGRKKLIARGVNVDPPEPRSPSFFPNECWALDKDYDDADRRRLEATLRDQEEQFRRNPRRTKLCMKLSLTNWALSDSRFKSPERDSYLGRAIELMKHHLDQNPRDEDAVEYYYSMLNDAHRCQDAREFFLARASMFPTDIRTLGTLAEMSFDRFKFREGMDFLARVEEIAGTDSAGYGSVAQRASRALLMVSAARLHDLRREVLDQGILAGEKALALNPKHRELLEWVASFHEEMATLQPGAAAIHLAKAESWRKIRETAPEEPLDEAD